MSDYSQTGLPMMRFRFRHMLQLMAAVGGVITTPAAAQRLVELRTTPRSRIMLDLDSITRDGPMATYAVRVTRTSPRAEVEYVLSRAVINCQTHKRQTLGTEDHLVTGAVERDGRAGEWRPIAPDSGLHRTEQLVCSSSAQK